MKPELICRFSQPGLNLCPLTSYVWHFVDLNSARYIQKEKTHYGLQLWISSPPATPSHDADLRANAQAGKIDLADCQITTHPPTSILTRKDQAPTELRGIVTVSLAENFNRFLSQNSFSIQWYPPR